MDYWAHYFFETTNSYQHVTTILIPLFGHLSDKKRMCMPPPQHLQKNIATTPMKTLLCILYKCVWCWNYKQRIVASPFAISECVLSSTMGHVIIIKCILITVLAKKVI